MRLLFLAILASVTLQWDPNPPSEQVTSYNVKWSNYSTIPFANSIDVGPETTYSFANISTGREYRFAVTAHNPTAESAYSNIVTVRIPTPPQVRTIFSGTVEIR